MEKAGGYLARRAHSREELRTKLSKTLPEVVVAATLERLDRHGLIDDRAMATQWVEERAHKRGASALIEELKAKGISDDDIDAATASLDEDVRARELAHRLYGKVAGKPVRKQGPALAAMLLRRGFSFETAEAAARSVLPPEGWD
jgi:regulatory protein